MGRKAAVESIQENLDMRIVPLGNYNFRDDNGGLRLTYPKTAEQLNGVSVGDKAEIHVDQKTGAAVIIPADESDVDEE